MPNTVVFLWISAGLASLGQPASGPELELSRALRSALADFGAARGLDLEPVGASRPSGLPANDAAIADAIEAELEQARTALAALEEAAASARLSRVEAQLLSHPHLPQAAFLMGECLALEAQAAREHEPARSNALEARRFALEGPRARAFGEPAAASSPPPLITLPIRGLSTADTLELDGATLPQGETVTVAPGLHHARVWRRGRPIFATFTEIVAEQQALELAAPPFEPCSAEDLELAPRHHPAADAELAGVACPRWAEVRAEPGGIGVALCERNHCGDFVHWQRRAPEAFAPIAVERERFPAWAGFAIAGAAALVTSGVVLWQSGAFERGHRSAETWQYGGLNPQGIRF